MLELIGVLAMIQGFGSAAAYEFFGATKFGFMLRWATEYQPWAGIVLGILGLGACILGDHLRKSRKGTG